MLAVQVQYWTLKEAERHNLATEDLGNRTLQETQRHNIVTENETIRHNVTSENETQRHNLATEQYYSNALMETTRHNVSTEGISTANLAISSEQNRIAQQNADTSAYRANTERFQAVGNYNLGLDSNRISQQNADNNTRNLDLIENQQKLDFLKFGASDKQAASSAKQAEAAYTNSLVNMENAETRKGELDLGYDRLELDQSRFNWQQFTDVLHLKNESTKNLIQGVNAFSNIIEAIN